MQQYKESVAFYIQVLHMMDAVGYRMPVQLIWCHDSRTGPTSRHTGTPILLIGTLRRAGRDS
jgi:hypothetical protein